MANKVAIIETRATQLAEKIEVLVTEARKKVASVVNTVQVYTYYEIGRYIIEDEQGGKINVHGSLSKIPDTVLEIENKEIPDSDLEIQWIEEFRKEDEV